MNNTVYTIGYTGFTIEEFLKTLKDNDINVVIDVRSSPYSERYPDYNKESLSFILKAENIYYRNYASEFGARQDNRSFYSSEGYLDFDLFAKSEQFLSGVKKMKNSIAQGYKIVFLCAEKKPVQCHRAILVARAFHNLGYKVIHFLPENKTATHDDIEDELLLMHCKDADQISIDSLFSNINIEETMNKKEYLKTAYRAQNKKIAYRIEEDEE